MLTTFRPIAVLSVLALLTTGLAAAATPCQSCKIDEKKGTRSCGSGDGKREGGSCKVDKNTCMTWGTCDKPIRALNSVAINTFLVLSGGGNQSDSAEDEEPPESGAPYTPAAYPMLKVLHAQVIVTTAGFDPEDTIVSDGRVRIGFGLDPPDSQIPNHRQLTIWNLTGEKVLVFTGILPAGTPKAIHVPGTDLDVGVEWRLLTDQEPKVQRAFLDGLAYAEGATRWYSDHPRPD